MRTRILPMLFLALAVFLHPLRAEEKGGAVKEPAKEPVKEPAKEPVKEPAKEPVKDETEREEVSPSPDGKFAFMASFSPEARSLDLIEKATKKVLMRVAESEEDSNRLSTKVLWAPDSRRFAISISTVFKRTSEVGVYTRSGATFRKTRIPKLPEAALPKGYASDPKRFWHTASLNWEDPVCWRKDGSLVVEINTTVDGNDNTATALRTVVIGFGKNGAGKILDSSLKLTRHLEKD